MTKIGLVDLGASALAWSFRSPIDLVLLAIPGQQLLAAELPFGQCLPQPGGVSQTWLLHKMATYLIFFKIGLRSCLLVAEFFIMLQSQQSAFLIEILDFVFQRIDLGSQIFIVAMV